MLYGLVVSLADILLAYDRTVRIYVTVLCCLLKFCVVVVVVVFVAVVVMVLVAVALSVVVVVVRLKASSLISHYVTPNKSLL